MKAQVLFYFNAPRGLHSACQIIEKHYLSSSGKKIMIFCQDHQQAVELDGLLWRFKKISFLPHSLSHSPLKDEAPIVLTNIKENKGVMHSHPLVINLSHDLLTHLNHALLIVEVLSIEDSDQKKSLARNRFRYYREQFSSFTPIDFQEIDSPSLKNQEAAVFDDTQ